MEMFVSHFIDKIIMRKRKEKGKGQVYRNTLTSHLIVNWLLYTQLFRPNSTSTSKVIWHWFGNPGRIPMAEGD